MAEIEDAQTGKMYEKLQKIMGHGCPLHRQLYQPPNHPNRPITQVAEIEDAEKGKMREKVQNIIGYGINCFINRQLIYNFPEEIFADAGVMAIGEHVGVGALNPEMSVTIFGRRYFCECGRHGHW